MKKIVAYFIQIILCFVFSNITAAEFQLPGRLESEGTHFELKDSSYLNITLNSSEPVKVILESVPEIITFRIESISGANSTQITLFGFLPATTYYKYEDNYHNLELFVTDNTGKYTDKTPPQVNIAANPNILWPPDHKLVDVAINGEAKDNLSGIASTEFKVIDEYTKIEPIISGFNSLIQLESWRNGDDLNGRTYNISVITKDRADNESSSSTTVICPHDQRKDEIGG